MISHNGNGTRADVETDDCAVNGGVFHWCGAFLHELQKPPAFAIDVAPKYTTVLGSAIERWCM